VRRPCGRKMSEKCAWTGGGCIRCEAVAKALESLAKWADPLLAGLTVGQIRVEARRRAKALRGGRERVD